MALLRKSVSAFLIFVVTVFLLANASAVEGSGNSTDKIGDSKKELPPRVDKNSSMLCFWVTDAPPINGSSKIYPTVYNGSFSTVPKPPKIGSCWHLNANQTTILRGEQKVNRTIPPLLMSGPFIYNCTKLYTEYPVCGRNYSHVYVASKDPADGANSLRGDIANNGPFSVGWSVLTGNLLVEPADGNYLRFFANEMWEGNFTFLGWYYYNWTLVVKDEWQNLTNKWFFVEENETLALINLTAAARWRNVSGLNFYL